MDATDDATAQAELVRTGTCSQTELIETAIERIERIDPQLNAVIMRFFDEALDTVPADGPFRGVPLLLKDLGCSIEGMPLHCGVEAMKDRDYRATTTSHLAQRLLDAGFVVVGKTNTPELGLSPTTEPVSYGPTRNPWSLDHGVGGSSGGSASAVAACLTPVAHAGDGGGSIRNPAGACGLVGLKPSRARTSVGPESGEGWSSCVSDHVVTRSVRDTAAVLDAVAGPMPGDPYYAPPPERPFAAEVGRDPGRLRIGLYADGGNPDALGAVETAAGLLAELGHEVDEAYPAALDEGATGEIGSVLVAANVAAELDAMGEATGRPIGEDGVEPATWAIAQRGRELRATELLTAIDAMHAYGRRLRSWWSDYDILVTPTMSEAAPPIGELRNAPIDRIVALVPYTMPYNLSGQPAIALPLYWTAATDEAPELPVGIQLVGEYASESRLIRLASQLEQAQPWIDKLPPIHG